MLGVKATNVLNPPKTSLVVLKDVVTSQNIGTP